MKKLYHYTPTGSDTIVWNQPLLKPCKELIFSWNGQRPQRGELIFSVTIEGETIPYATWSANGQKTFSICGKYLQVSEDILTIHEQRSDQFTLTVEGKGLASIRSLHACATHSHILTPFSENKQSFQIPLPQLSQEENRRVCSPTATLALIHFLTKQKQPSLKIFSKNVHDDHHLVYGNWVLNLAEASHHLGSNWCCYVDRLSGLDALFSHIRKGIPAVISVVGPLQGGASNYSSGHLLAVTGYDAKTKSVICMDPAFPYSTPSPHHYLYREIEKGWSKRGGLTYIIEKRFEYN